MRFQVKVYAGDYFNGEIIFVPQIGLKYVGRNTVS